MHGGALGLSCNTLGLAREDLARYLTDAGLVVQEGARGSGLRSWPRSSKRRRR